MTRKQQRDYIREEAEIYGVPFDVAQAIFDQLGESEMFDGFINELEDIEYEFKEG